jgi:hypothetical protein
LASLVLASTAVEHGAGNVAVNGFLIDMPALFERFVTVSLREALVADYGGRVDEQARYYFDRAAQVILRPDIVWQSGTEIRCHAIDLSLEPDQLLGQVRDLAGTIAAAQGEAHLTPRGSFQ